MPYELNMLNPNRKLLIQDGFLFLILVVFVLFLSSTNVFNSVQGRTGSCGDVIVQIEGDVRYPGFYFFDEQTAVEVLLEQAGGIKSAQHAAANLNDIPIHSGSKLIAQSDRGNPVFIHEEISPFNKITLGLTVSINKESEEGLTAVPGIGPVTAKSIVKERTSRGGFKTLEELRSVKGIGSKTYSRIRAYVTL